MKKLSLCLISVALLSASRPAFASFSLTGVGAVNFGKPSLQVSGTSVDNGAKLAFGFGALAEFPINPLIGLEVGVLYLPFKSSVTIGGTETVSTFKQLQFPAIVRFNLIPMLSAGGGAYLGLMNGTINNSSNGSSSDSTYADNKLSTTDFGFLLSVALDLPVGPLLDVTFDARYQIGVANLAQTSGDSAKLGGVYFLAGLKLKL